MASGLYLLDEHLKNLRGDSGWMLKPGVLLQQGEEDATIFGHRVGVEVFPWRIELNGFMSGIGRGWEESGDGRAALDNGLHEEPFEDDVMDGTCLFMLSEMLESNHEAAVCVSSLSSVMMRGPQTGMASCARTSVA